DRDAGGVWLNNKTIQKPAVQEALRRIGKQVPEGHKVLLAACDVGKNKDLLQKIADLMGREAVAPKKEIGSNGLEVYIRCDDVPASELEKYPSLAKDTNKMSDFEHAYPPRSLLQQIIGAIDSACE